MTTLTVPEQWEDLGLVLSTQMEIPPESRTPVTEPYPGSKGACDSSVEALAHALSPWLGYQSVETSIFVPIEKVLENLSQRPNWRLEKLEGVRQYLCDFPDLVDTLDEVIQILDTGFPVDAEFVLTLYEDPEIDDHYVNILVRAPNDVERLLQALDKAQEEYCDLLTETKGWILVTTDFKKAQGT